MSKEVVFFLVGYLVAMNVLGMVIMAVDKKRAQKHQWRISEKSLFLVAIFGGSLGSLLGMQCFRHKTKHLKFVYGIPAILIIHVILFIFLKKI